MEKIRITQPTLGLDFEFEPDAGVEVDNQYVFDIIKKENLVTGSAMLEAWQKPNTTEEDKEFIRQAYKSKYFDDESDGDFVDAIKEGFFSFGRGVGNVAELNNANEKYEQLLVDTGQAKMEKAPVVPMGYGGFTLGGKGTEFKELPEATQKILEEDPQSARFSFGVLSKKDRQKIDKTALDFFNYFRKINTEGNVVTQAMDFAQGNTDAFKSRENDPGKMRDRVKYFLKRNKLNYEDDGLVDEIIRRGGEIGRAQENVDFYQGLAEWSGGYSMLSNFITKYGAKAGSSAKNLKLNEYGYIQGEPNPDEEIDIDLNYLAENNRLAKGMEEGAENVAIAFGDKKAELALRDELIKPNPDSAMVYSFAPDIPVELVTAGMGAMTQAGVSGFRRFATKGQIEVLQQETERVLRNIGKSEDAIAFNKQNDGLGVLSGEADATRFASATSRQNKKLDILEKNLSAQKAELNKLVTRTNELTGNLTKPGFLQEGVGNLSRGIGYGADGLGRTIEVVRSLTKEAGVDLIMKVTKKTPEEAERMFFTIAGVGGVGIGVGAFGNENIDADFYDVLKGIGVLLGPEILQKTGTSLRHLGTHWVSSNGSKNVFEHVQQLNSKNPKFSNIIIDRTNGVDFMGKTLPAIGNIFRRGDTGKFMGKQGITRPERFIARSLVDTGADQALSFMGRAGLSATTASTLPTAFGYAMGGEEGAGMALGASLPIIGLGVGTGEIVRHNSKTMAQLKQRGDIANHRKNLSTDQAFLFDRLTQSNQAGLASAQIAFPDAQIQLVQGKDMRSAGSQTIRNGRSIIKINIDSEMPLLPVLSHEIGHHIKAHGLTPLIHDIMFGDPFKNKGGLFSRFDIETGKFLVENIDGVNRYETNDQFNGLREKYIKALENQPGGIDELTRREYSTREAIADEVFAEYVAQHILSNKSRDLSTGMLRSLFGAMSGKPFLRKAGHNMGLFSRSDDNLMFQVLPDSPELNNLITEFQKKSGRLSPEELADQDGVISRSDESENDVIITPEEQLKDPQILEAFNTGGIFKTDADGKIIYGIGGKPKLMTKTQIENQQGQMANNLLQAIENAGDSLPAGHVVMNDNETASGMFLSDAIIDKLQGYNASQKEFLRQVSAVGRRMAGPDGQTNPGNQAIMFYFSAMKHGGKYYRSLRGGYRNMLIYGMEVSKDKNIYFRTISFDQLDDNINYLLKHKAFGKQLIETFGGNSIGEVRKMINDKFDVYYSNQAKGIENGTDGSGITEGEKNFLNAFLGNTGSGNVDRNPILSALGKKQADKMTAIRSRRLDRIGSIEFPGGGQPVRIRKIIDNLMPGRKNPDQLEMEFEQGPTIIEEEPKPNFSWYKMNGVDPEDPNRLPKIADRLISPGNRDADGDIARDMHQNFGVTFREMIDALDKAHSRDEYKNSKYRYMPNLGLKDNVVDQVLPAINQEKFSGEQFNSAIGKVAGAKAYADDIGLTGFLEGKKSVTKTDIEDYVAENHLKLDSYDLADSAQTLTIDELLNIYGKDYPSSEEIIKRGDDSNFRSELLRRDNEFNRQNPNLRLVADDVAFQTRVNTIQDLIDFKEMGHTEVTFQQSNRTKYNRSTLVTPGERTNYNETLVEFEGGGRFEEKSPVTTKKVGVSIKFTDGDHIEQFNNFLDEKLGVGDAISFKEKYLEYYYYGTENDQMGIRYKGPEDRYKILEELEAESDGQMYLTHFEGLGEVTTQPLLVFKNAHWDSDKVIGHIRRTDRTIDGKDTRFLEEMQSDWLQAMRKGNAPDAPFAKNWPALLLKKAMMDAINDGKTHIAWADGKVHNDRYSLTRTLDDITMEPGTTPGIRELYLNTKEQGEIQLQVDGKGRVLNSDHEGFVGKGLDEVIGKQMADKILEEPSWDDALKRKKLNALDQEIDKYKQFAKEFESGRFNHSNDFINIGNATDLSSALRDVFHDYSPGTTLRSPEGRELFVDHIQDKIRDLTKQQDKVYDGIVKYEGKDLDLSDPALPNFYDKEVVKVATKLAKKLGVGKPEKVKVPYNPFPNIEHIPDGAWMMKLPTKQALGEQTLYMPTLGNEAPKGPSSPPEVVQSNSMAKRIKYKGVPAQEISNRIAQVSTELLEYGSDSNPQVESTRGSLYQAKRNGIIRELNELNEVEAGMLNQGDRFMPSLHPEAMPVVQATDKKTGKPKFAQRKNAEGNPIKGKYDPVYETIDYDLTGSPLVRKHNKKTNNKKVPWNKLSVVSLENASTAKEKGHKQLIQDIYNTDLVDIASQKLADEYTNVWSKDLSVQAGTGWYSRMRGKLSKFLGKKDHELFAQLLGATSARTPVEENFAQAFEAMTLFKQGKYDKKIKLYKEAYNALNEGNIIQLALKKGVIPKKGFVLKDGTISKAKDKPFKALTAWIEHYDLVPKKSDDGNFNINSGQVMRVITDSWLHLTTSPKTPNFAGNLTGRTLEATIDVWAGRYLRRMLYDGDKTWRIQPASETGVSDVDFALGQLIFREAGQKLGMNPDDLQAIAWFGEKGVWEQSGWTSETGALKSSFDESFDVFFPKGRKPRNFQEGREIMSYKASQRLLAKAEDMTDNPGNYPDKTIKQIEKYLKAKTNEESKRKALPNVARFLNE